MPEVSRPMGPMADSTTTGPFRNDNGALVCE